MTINTEKVIDVSIADLREHRADLFLGLVEDFLSYLRIEG